MTAFYLMANDREENRWFSDLVLDATIDDGGEVVMVSKAVMNALVRAVTVLERRVGSLERSVV